MRETQETRVQSRILGWTGAILLVLHLEGLQPGKGNSSKRLKTGHFGGKPEGAWALCSTERLNNLPKVTQLGGGNPDSLALWPSQIQLLGEK